MTPTSRAILRAYQAAALARIELGLRAEVPRERVTWWRGAWARLAGWARGA